jgi:ferredoxin-NADP reductase
VLGALDPPHDAEAYLCGPAGFTDDITAIGLDASRIHTEPFGPAAGLTPGIAPTPARTSHPPAGEPGNGPARRIRGAAASPS